MMVRNLKYTVSTVFLLPMYRIPFKEWTTAGFVNCYVKDESKGYGFPVLHIVCYGKEKYGQALDDIITMLDELVVDLYGYDKTLVVLVVKIPEEFMQDYLTVFNSLYSQLSDNYRELVSEQTDTGNKLYDQHIGKRLQLLIMEGDPIAKNFMAKEIINVEDVEIGESWCKFVFQNETLTRKEVDKIIYTPFFKEGQLPKGKKGDSI